MTSGFPSGFKVQLSIPVLYNYPGTVTVPYGTMVPVYGVRYGVLLGRVQKSVNLLLRYLVHLISAHRYRISY